MNDDCLSINNLSVSFSGDVVFENIDLNVKSGEIFGLMGLNGAGKTTLIKCVLGLRKQDLGTISVFGENTISGNSKSKLAYLPEKFEPPWFLTGMEFLKFSLQLYHKDFSEEDMISAAKSLSLDTNALNRRMNTYSKGMRQKLGLLGTLLTESSLFVLDEPMSGLDPMARSLVKNMILDMKSEKHTIFLSSHILADMDEICDRVALLDGGKIRYLGTPNNLKKKTSTDNLERAFLELIEKKNAA